MNEVKQKKTKINKHTKQKLIRRNNAKLFPIYKMFSWDLLCFYSIEFLFYTITKGITPSGVLIISAVYMLARIVMQLPAVALTDMLGRRKSMIIGNLLMFLYTIALMISPNIIWILVAGIIRSLGYDMKIIVETNLLYDSVATKGGEGLYSKLDAKGLSWYFWLDGISCLSTGYLFVINNYLPMIICMIFTLISTILSFKFKDVYLEEKKENKKPVQIIKNYLQEIRGYMKFCLRSSRMRAYTMFGALFYGLITTMDVFRSELIISKGVSEEQYATIFAIFIILAGMAVSISRKIQKRFKNKTLTVISLTYIAGCVVVGIVANACTNKISVPIIILIFALLKMCTAIWNNLEYKYLKNFTNEKVRNKVMFVYELIGGIVASIISYIGSFMLEQFNVSQTTLLFSLAGLVLIILTLDYMRPRFGLRPNQYKKEDIEFE
ncbi:MAG: MFS transporter [Clostridia bacterium]|nr:MFS transporter [Clostridia bacterium]